KIFFSGFEHLFREINSTVAGRLRTNDGSAPGQTFASHHAGKFVLQPLIHSEQKSDLARADADVARRHVRVRADVPEQLAHERLAKPRHLGVAFPVWIE